MKLSELIAKTNHLLLGFLKFCINNYILVLIAIGVGSTFIWGDDNKVEEETEVIYKIATGNDIDFSPNHKKD